MADITFDNAISGLPTFRKAIAQQQTGPTFTKAMAARGQPDLTPAITKPDGSVVRGEAGKHHDDIPGITDQDQRGFVDSSGKFLNRKQAGATAQAQGASVPSNLHSEDLISNLKEQGSTIVKGFKEGATAAGEQLKKDVTTPPDAGIGPGFDDILRAVKTALDAGGYLVSGAYGGLNAYAQFLAKKLGASDRLADAVGAAIAQTGTALIPMKGAGGLMAREGEAAAGEEAAGGIRQPPEKPPAVEPPAPPGGKGPGKVTIPVGQSDTLILEQPKPGETESARALRWDDAANRLQTNDQATKMEVRTWVDKLPEHLRDDGLWQRVTADIEGRLGNAKHSFSDETKEALATIKPYTERMAKAAKWIVSHGNVADEDVPEIKTAEQGFAPRKVKGRTGALDRLDPEQNWQRDPIMSTTGGPGAKSLSKFSPNLQKRVLTDPIEKIEAETDVRYHKNYAVNVFDTMARLERIKNNMEVTDGILNELKESDQVWRSKWQIGKNADGTLRYGKANTPRPDGYAETNIPQLRDYYFPEKTAKVLDAIFAGDKDPDWLRGVARVNRVLNGSLFWNPIPHQLNVLSDFTISRGWNWLNPLGYRSLMLNGSRAVRALVTRNQDYVNFMRDGAALHLPGIEQKNFYDVLLKKFGAEVRANPSAFAEWTKALGLKNVGQLADLISGAVRKEYGLSSKMMWGLDDFLKMTRYLELMQRGISRREAIALAEKDIASYRVHPQLMGSTALSAAVKSPILTSFSRYHYGKVRSIALMMRDLMKGTAQERVDAAGKVAVVGAMLYLLKPMLSSLAQRATGEKKATAGPFGTAAIADRARGLATGQDAQGQPDDFAWQKLISQILDLSPAAQMATEIPQNHYGFSGQDIINPKASPLGKAVQAGEYAASKVGPLQTAMEMTKPGGTKRAIAGEVGVRIPGKGQSPRSKRAERRGAMRQEQRDPIEDAIKRVIRMMP